MTPGGHQEDETEVLQLLGCSGNLALWDPGPFFLDPEVFSFVFWRNFPGKISGEYLIWVVTCWKVEFFFESEGTLKGT